MIVSALKENGEVVAMTGDGVNDAPALKRADIGVAMGLTGTDVSKQAANMVLADDSFSTIVTAIQEGRVIYANLRKFIFYIFSSNLGEVLTIFFAIIFDLPTPFTALLILAVNLATDMLPALALSYEPAEANILDHPPRSPTARIMEKAFIKRLLVVGTSIGILVTVPFVIELLSYGWFWEQPITLFVYQKALSVSFAGIVLIQIFNSFNARSEVLSIFKLPFFSNPKLLIALASSLLLTVAIIEVPFLQPMMNTTHLNPLEWLMVIGFSVMIIPVEELRKKLSKKAQPTETIIPEDTV
jgi:Ca2+-transporting ATPase